MKRYKTASVLMLIHGALMELGVCLCLIPVFVLGKDTFDIHSYMDGILACAALILILTQYFGDKKIVE